MQPFPFRTDDCVGRAARCPKCKSAVVGPRQTRTGTSLGQAISHSPTAISSQPWITDSQVTARPRKKIERLLDRWSPTTRQR